MTSDARVQPLNFTDKSETRIPTEPRTDSMDSKPKLDLPPRQELGLRPQPSTRSWPLFLIILLLAAVLAFEILGWNAGTPKLAQEPTSIAASGDDIPLKDLSARLQRNNLPGAAAQVLEERLEALEPAAREERRKTLVTLATLLMRAERHEEAIVRLFQAEYLGPDSEQQTLIDRKVRECMEKLGRHDELSYELADRSQSPEARKKGTSPGDEAAGRIVARIGVETITASDLDAMIAEQVELQLDSMPGLGGEQREGYRTQILQGLKSPQRRLETLQQIVAQRTLYREGMERRIDRQEGIQRELEKARESLIARQVVLEALSGVSISDGDVQLFFQAEQARYAVPAGARVRLAVLESEEAALEALTGIQTEEDFTRVASEKSLHPSKENGGLLPEALIPGAAIPGLGANPALDEAIAASEAGKATAKPVAVNGGHAIVWIVEKTPGRMPAIDEVRDQVLQDYSRRKEMEKQQELIQELFKKHAVTIHAEAFLDLSGLEQSSDAAPSDPGTTPTKTPVDPNAKGN